MTDASKLVLPRGCELSVKGDVPYLWSIAPTVNGAVPLIRQQLLASGTSTISKLMRERYCLSEAFSNRVNGVGDLIKATEPMQRVTSPEPANTYAALDMCSDTSQYFQTIKLASIDDSIW